MAGVYSLANLELRLVFLVISLYLSLGNRNGSENLFCRVVGKKALLKLRELRLELRLCLKEISLCVKEKKS